MTVPTWILEMRAAHELAKARNAAGLPPLPDAPLPERTRDDPPFTDEEIAKQEEVCRRLSAEGS